MLRLVVDTNVYVDWLNSGRHEDVLFQRSAVKNERDYRAIEKVRAFRLVVVG